MTTTRRPHGLVYALLAVSLVANMVAAGYFLGAGFAEYSGKPPRTQRSVESTIEFVVGRYPESVRPTIRQKLEARRAEMKAALHEMRAARVETRKAIRQEPLDKGRIEKAFAASREKMTAFQSLIQGAIIEALPDLPQSERGKLEKDEDAEEVKP